MPLVTRFDTPASLTDMPAGSVFYDNWHNYLATSLNTVAGTGTALGEFYDASETDVDVLAEHSLVWMAFPRQVLVAHRDDRREAFIQADADVATRNPQNEYCEWHVTRNAADKITKVVFVTESPEYWHQMWAVDRAVVVGLYAALVGAPVVEADLRVGGPGSAYKALNPFNTTLGIVHLVQSINTLSAALGLAQGSIHTGAARDNYETSPPGLRTSVDARVKFDIGALARAPTSLSITLREPIGLYITGYDDTGWTKPDGSAVDDYWRIVRGSPGQILRLEYQVPPGAGFVVGDILIGGRPIEWGGQIAEHVTCMVGGVAGRRTR